jgi:hypothetical protein
MFLNAPQIANSRLGVLGWVNAQLVSALDNLFLFKFERDRLSHSATVFAAVLGKSESVMSTGAVKTALLAIGLNGVLVFQTQLASLVLKLV